MGKMSSKLIAADLEWLRAVKDTPAGWDLIFNVNDWEFQLIKGDRIESLGSSASVSRFCLTIDRINKESGDGIN